MNAMKLISKAAIKDPADNNNELGYLQNFSESYFIGQKLGKGGSGTALWQLVDEAGS